MRVAMVTLVEIVTFTGTVSTSMSMEVDLEGVEVVDQGEAALGTV